MRARDHETKDSLHADRRPRIGPLAYLKELLQAYFTGRQLNKWLLNRRIERDRYHRALAKWQTEHDELQKEIRFAMDKPPALDGTSDLVPIMPHKGECLFLVAQGAALVEPKRLPGQWVGGYSGVSFRVMKGVSYHIGGSRGQYVPGPEIPTPTAVGTATITNQRITFQSGQQAREFHFSKLIGYQHDPQAPVTYFQGFQPAKGFRNWLHDGARSAVEIQALSRTRSFSW